MTQAVNSTIKARNRLWAAVGGSIRLWSTLSKSSGELVWVLAGKFALMGANAAVMLFLAELLDLNTYGLLVITISGQLLISRLLMMGVDSAMVRLTTIPELESRSREVVTAGLVFMAFTSAALIGVMLLGIPVLAHFGIPSWLLPCIVAGAIGSALVDYGYSYRLARQEYPLAALAQGGTAVWRLGLTALAAVKLPRYVFAVFVAYHGASLTSGLVQTFLIPRISGLPDRRLITRLLSYSSWLGPANVIVIFSLYQGTFLLMVLNQPAETGVFGLALSFSLGFFAIYNAYSEYLSVRVRSLENIEDLPQFIRNAMTAALILMLACVPVIFVVWRLIPWFLGPEWLEVAPVFVYLSISMVLIIARAPLVAASHYLLKPKLITFEWVMQAGAVGVFGLILAPHMGATGAAIAQLFGSALALVLLSYLVAVSWRAAAKVQD